MTRTMLFIGFATGIVALVIACSGGSDNTSGSSGGTSGTSGTSGTATGTSGTAASGTSGTGAANTSGFKDCGRSSASNCTDAEYKPYTDCLSSKCGDKFTACYGAGYQSGTFSGDCGSLITCQQACACGDTACETKCPAPAGACITCSQNLATCVQQCTPPACAGAPSSSGGLPDAGGSSGATCADLQACCDKIAAGETKSGCQTAHDSASGNNTTCSTYLAGFKTLCP